MDWNMLRLPRKFASMVDGQDPCKLALWVSGGSTNIWSVEVLFDRVGQMFLHNGWKLFARLRANQVRHFLVFTFDDRIILTVKVFDETMCHRHYHSDEDD
jgi:hypothetical protein